MDKLIGKGKRIPGSGQGMFEPGDSKKQLLDICIPWKETIPPHKVTLSRFSYETLVRSVQNLFQVVFPLFCLLVLTLCILLVVLLLPPAS